MKRKVFICFLVMLVVSVIIFYSTKQDNLEAAGSAGSEDAIVEEKEENKMIDRSTLRRIEEYKKLLEDFKKSNYIVIEDKVERKCKESKLTLAEEKDIKIITKALNGIKGKISVPEGAKVIVLSDENRHVVIFENKLSKGARGGDYSARVIVDSKSGEILEILGSD